MSPLLFVLQEDRIMHQGQDVIALKERVRQAVRIAIAADPGSARKLSWFFRNAPKEVPSVPTAGA
jgi:hypothetical protein